MYLQYKCPNCRNSLLIEEEDIERITPEMIEEMIKEGKDAVEKIENPIIKKVLWYNKKKYREEVIERTKKVILSRPYKRLGLIRCIVCQEKAYVTKE